MGVRRLCIYNVLDTLKKINTMHENKENCSDMIVLLKDQVNAVSEVIGEKVCANPKMILNLKSILSVSIYLN